MADLTVLKYSNITVLRFFSGLSGYNVVNDTLLVEREVNR